MERLTVGKMIYNNIEILAPKWSNKSVLIADWKIGANNRVEITATKKDGTRYYPQAFYITGDKIKQYPKQAHSVRSVYIVPIDALEVASDN